MIEFEWVLCQFLKLVELYENWPSEGLGTDTFDITYLFKYYFHYSFLSASSSVML